MEHPALEISTKLLPIVDDLIGMIIAESCDKVNQKEFIAYKIQVSFEQMAKKLGDKNVCVTSKAGAMIVSGLVALILDNAQIVDESSRTDPSRN